MRVRPIWRHGEVGRSSCRVGEAGAVAVATGGRERAMSRRSTATGKQRRDSGRIRSWSRFGGVNNSGGESAPLWFTRPSSRQLQQHGVRGTRPSARRQMDSVSGIREEGGCEIGAVGGAMEVGLRFRGSGEGSFPGEKVIWRPRGMNGELGGGTMSYGRICLKCGGELQFYPYL